MQQNEKYIEIKKILLDSVHGHLADCMDMVPEQNMAAIAMMINKERANEKPEGSIRYMVVQDMASLISGHISMPLFSEKYTDDNRYDGGGICDKCGNDDNMLYKVSVPDTDVNKVCNDCKRTLEMYEGTVGVL
ncbi:hypothetical protein CAP35_13890 [Chitinophagaceae bacterium IBVUCB1]|nr:hypothetical protein CAP35_13890 [Chitinophagaceae bacterium IBVUCB1]